MSKKNTKVFGPGEYNQLRTDLQGAFERLKGAESPEEQWKAVMGVQTVLVRNYEHLSDHGKKACDHMLQQFLAHLEPAIAAMPDTAQARELRRNLKGIRGQRLNAKAELRRLELRPRKPGRLYSSTRRLFQKHLQHIMDLWQDVSGQTLSGQLQFALFYLIGLCIEEMLVAAHLAYRSYCGQAFTHIRAVHEALDLVDLFLKDPSQVDVWMTGQWWKLMPKNVRKKLKRDDIFAKLYSLFSGIGVHPFYEGARARVRMRATKESGERLQLLFRLGNMGGTKEAIACQVYLLTTLSSLFVAIMKSFPQFLNEQEVDQFIAELLEDTYRYLDRNIFRHLKDQDPSIGEFKKSLREELNNIKRVLKIPESQS